MRLLSISSLKSPDLKDAFRFPHLSFSTDVAVPGAEHIRDLSVHDPARGSECWTFGLPSGRGAGLKVY
jgi:hypothetical protein